MSNVQVSETCLRADCYNSLVTSNAGLGARRELLPDLSHVSWRKSSRSTYTNGCVEVGPFGNGLIGVRDTKQCGEGPMLIFGEAAWGSFLADLSDGRHRRP